ncbi:Low molecular weight protein-tyrosine-phosphatase YfkJ [Halioglobus japonicus]|nr:Low molecular weight protein-tyrosine-phosphatase YfkJ [Halioglobus japonicus]
MPAANQTSVLFVCLGNICRSPTAEGVFTELAQRAGQADAILVDSCGTSNWHIGSTPDPRAIVAAAERGYNISYLRARQVNVSDFDTFDYILAMDEDNLAELQSLCPGDYRGHLSLFLDFAPDTPLTDVPDPYYKGDQGFAEVLDLVESASAGLLQRIVGGHS